MANPSPRLSAWATQLRRNVVDVTVSKSIVPGIKATTFRTVAMSLTTVKSVRLVAGRLGLYPGRVTLKTLKIVSAAFAPGARHKRKCEGFYAYVARHVRPLTAFNHSRLIIVMAAN